MFSYFLIPIYGQDMSENDFLTVAAKFRFCSIFSETKIELILTPSDRPFHSFFQLLT